MGLALEALKKRSDAMKAYETAVKYAPKFIPAQWLYCMSQLPVVYENQEEIRNCRNRYQEELITLRNKVFSGTKQDAAGLIRLVGSCPPFYLSYQGLNNRDLQHVYGEMVCHIMESGFPQWTRRPEMPPVSNGEKIRVGIVSGFFRLHSVWKIPVRGWIEHLDKNRFSLYGYYTGREKDAQTEFARKCFDHFTENIHDIHELIEIIRKDNLHLIIYPEIGMDPLTKNLAALRLAPVQCTSWGHPDTSGIPTIDYFLSSELMEPANGEDHYNEKLIRLPALSISYTPLEMPMDKGNREIFGLKSNSVLYFCAQSLYKYLPQYDDVFPRIAGQIDDCQFLFISSKNPGITEIMRTRVNNKFAEYGLDSKKHIVFLPFLDPVEYQMVNMFSDVFLDSIGWSGCNSTFEALACDLPVVTLPGKFMRGRHSYAILKMMNVHETIANSIDEYVDIAVKLGKDPQWRKHISDRMSENKHRVYRDTTCIRALEDFIEKAVWEEAHRPVEAD
jgi:predicted O-linked N-acetylglucosamine transferase (SPINDLY family)